MTRFDDAANYVLSRSWWCRRYKKSSRQMIDVGLELMGSFNGGMNDEEMKELLKISLSRRVRRDVKNPILIFILLQIILPIVIRLLIEWWFSEGRE